MAKKEKNSPKKPPKKKSTIPIKNPAQKKSRKTKNPATILRFHLRPEYF